MRAEIAPSSPDRATAELAAAQHGVVARAQLERLGLSSAAIGRRVDACRLHRVHRGIYAVGHPLLTAEGRLMAAVLACGDGAVLSHRSAASLLALRPSATARVDVTVPSRGGRKPRAGIAVHRPKSLPAEHLTRHHGIAVTTPARTLVDLAAVVDQASLRRAVDRAETLRLFDLRAVQAVLDLDPRRAGSRALVEILGLGTSAALTRSELEDRFLELCAAERIERPIVNARVGPYEVDFLWPRHRLVVETDGHRHHGTRDAFERDRARDARLVVAGYRVLRFTFRQVTREPAFVASVLRSVIEAAGGGSRSR